MTNLNEILTAAQNLSAVDRAQLIAALWDNASPEDWVGPAEDWIAESRHRSDQYESGTMQGDSWETVRERANRKAGLDD
jgi:putative addiction module component (TIGR02574 family)